MKTNVFLSDKVYNVLKYLTLIVIPGLATLYFTMSQIWNLPYGESVVATSTAICTFLGLLIGVSTSSYNNSDAPYNGVIDVTTSEDGTKDVYSLVLDSDPSELRDKKSVTFKVNNSET